MGLATDTAYSAAGGVVLAVGRLATAALLARALGPRMFGEVAFVQWLLDVTFLIVSFGLPGVLTRFLPEILQQNREHVVQFARPSLAWGILTSFGVGAIALGYTAFAGNGDNWTASLVAAWALLNTFMALISAALQGLRRFRLLWWGNCVAALVSVIGAAALNVGASFAQACAVYVLATSAFLLFSVMGCRDIIRERARSSGRRGLVDWTTIRRYGLNIWIAALIGSLVWGRGELGILKAAASEEALGLYAVALTVSGAVYQAASLFTGAIGPHLAAAWANGHLKLIAQSCRIVTQIVMLVTAGMATFLVLFAEPIIAILFGSKYLPAAAPMVLLAMGSLGIASGAANSVLQLSTNGRFSRDSNLIGAAILFSVAAIAAPLLGAAGAAVARSLAQLTVAVFAFVLLTKVTGLKQAAFSLMWRWVALLCATATFSGLVLAGLLPVSMYVRVPVCAALFGVILCIGTDANLRAEIDRRLKLLRIRLFKQG